MAENYRRDPINRLAKALLDAGVIGSPRLMIHQTSGGGNQMVISVWRHQKDQSGVLLDVGVHFADIMEYFMGEVSTVYAQTRLHEPTRYNPAALGKESTSNPAGVYGKWQREMPAEFEATAEDANYATLVFKSGAVGAIYGGPRGAWAGPLVTPDSRLEGVDGYAQRPHRASTLTSHARAQPGPSTMRPILDLVPDFHLNEATAQLFGGDRSLAL